MELITANNSEMHGSVDYELPARRPTDSVEYSGVVLPRGAELFAPKVTFWDAARTRLMVYPQEALVEPTDEKTTGHNFDLDAARRSIRAAEKVAEKISRAHWKALARVKSSPE